MRLDSITISSPEVGRCNSFIYCIYICEPQGLVYIGETRSEYGALGRLSGHMQAEQGTFIKKCIDKNINIDEVRCDINMLAFNLSDYPEYCGELNNSNRRALEYFVHGCMEEYSVDDKTVIPFDVVSWTTIASRLSDNENIYELAEKIAREFYEKIPFH